MNGRLQCERAVADVAGFSERLIDHRVERDDAPDELTSLGLRVRQSAAPPEPTCGKTRQ